MQRLKLGQTKAGANSAGPIPFDIGVKKTCHAHAGEPCGIIPVQTTIKKLAAQLQRLGSLNWVLLMSDDPVKGGWWRIDMRGAA